MAEEQGAQAVVVQVGVDDASGAAEHEDAVAVGVGNDVLALVTGPALSATWMPAKPLLCAASSRYRSPLVAMLVIPATPLSAATTWSMGCVAGAHEEAAAARGCAPV